MVMVRTKVELTIVPPFFPAPAGCITFRVPTFFFLGFDRELPSCGGEQGGPSTPDYFKERVRELLDNRDYYPDVAPAVKEKENLRVYE